MRVGPDKEAGLFSEQVLGGDSQDAGGRECRQLDEELRALEVAVKDRRPSIPLSITGWRTPEASRRGLGGSVAAIALFANGSPHYLRGMPQTLRNGVKGKVREATRASVEKILVSDDGSLTLEVKPEGLLGDRQPLHIQDAGGGG